MTETELVPEILSSPYYQKREGEFEKALEAYASRLKNAQAHSNQFLIETCFDQIFDVQLLLYAKNGKRFSGIQELKRRLRRDIQSILNMIEDQTPDELEKLFTSCWNRFTPRGRGRNPFSVDRRLLIPSEFLGAWTQNDE